MSIDVILVHENKRRYKVVSYLIGGDVIDVIRSKWRFTILYGISSSKSIMDYLTIKLNC